MVALVFLLFLFFFLKEIIVKGNEIDRFFLIFFLFKDAECLENYFQFQAEVVAAVYGYFGRVQYLRYFFHKLFAVAPRNVNFQFGCGQPFVGGPFYFPEEFSYSYAELM